jgi:5-methylcytosine-specific restriction endonuclease McrA
MPCDYKKYPENWKWLSKQVIADAGDKCELCYAPNGVTIVRWTKQYVYPWTERQGVLNEGKETKIVLTVHHIDGDKANNSKQNLIALCQKCHLRLDLGRHMANRKRNKDKAQEKLQLNKHKCEECVKFDIVKQNYSLDCYECKRFYGDMYRRRSEKE